jgi:hypothetical protein
MTERRSKNPAWAMSLDVGVDDHGFRPWLWKEELVPLFDSRAAAWGEWRARTYPAPKERGGMAMKELVSPSPLEEEVSAVLAAAGRRPGTVADAVEMVSQLAGLQSRVLRSGLSESIKKELTAAIVAAEKEFKHNSLDILCPEG